MAAPVVVESPAPLPLEDDEKSRLQAMDPFTAAIALVDAGRIGDSGPYWRKALAAAPRDGQRWYAWGATLGQVGRFEEAERALWGAIGLGYEASAVWEALGVVYIRLRKLVEAEQAYEQAVAKDPKNAASWLALGNARFARGDAVRGRVCYERAIGAVGRNDTADPANLAQARLWLGHWRLGFKAYEQRRMMSEWRMAMQEAIKMPGGPLGVRQGVWVRREKDGGYGPLDGRPIIVMAEQGQGDGIQFARFLPEVVQRTGCEVWFRSHSTLVPLMAGAFADQPKIRVLDKGDTLGPADVQGWVPLMSLPYFLGVANPTHLPPPIRPYGLGWVGGAGVYVHEQGNTAHAYDWDRSAPTGTLTGMVERSGQTVVRYEDGDDWQKTVEKMRACARVVTVDTAVAHVAGSLGIPTDIFVPSLPEWRWGSRKDSHSPWYPSATLWWRTKSDGWDDVTTRWMEARK